MGNWDYVWSRSRVERRSFAYTSLVLKGFEVNWTTGAIERPK